LLGDLRPAPRLLQDRRRTDAPTPRARPDAPSNCLRSLLAISRCMHASSSRSKRRRPRAGGGRVICQSRRHAALLHLAGGSEAAQPARSHAASRRQHKQPMPPRSPVTTTASWRCSHPFSFPVHEEVQLATAQRRRKCVGDYLTSGPQALALCQKCQEAARVMARWCVHRDM
jgi:hypothetical protein